MESHALKSIAVFYLFKVVNLPDIRHLIQNRMTNTEASRFMRHFAQRVSLLRSLCAKGWIQEVAFVVPHLVFVRYFILLFIERCSRLHLLSVIFPNFHPSDTLPT